MMTIEAFFAVLTWLVVLALVVMLMRHATSKPTPTPDDLESRRDDLDRRLGLCADDTDGMAP